MAIKPKLAYLAYIIYPDKEMEFLGLASTDKEASKLFSNFKLPERYSEEDINKFGGMKFCIEEFLYN